MPTYEYRCPQGHSFDVFQRMSDEPVATCPECGEKARRLISGGAGFLFKGEGFYITDYRSKEYREKVEAEKGDGTKKTKKKTVAGDGASASDTSASGGGSAGAAPDSGGSSAGGSGGASGGASASGGAGGKGDG